jgi:hypothetical protein
MIDQQHEDVLARSLRLAETFDPFLVDMVLREVTAGKVVTGTGSGLTMSSLDSSAVALPGNGRSVSTLSAYLANNAAFNVKDYGAVGNGTADDTTAIQAAITAAAAEKTGGVVLIPPGTYKTTKTLTVPSRVSIVGFGGEASTVAPSNCDGISLGVSGDVGSVNFSDFGIVGTACTTRTAFKSQGTSSSTDWTTGVHIHAIRVTDFQTAMRFRNLHQSTIRECWFQRINIGLNLSGQNMVNRIVDNTMVYDTGCGAGTVAGIIVAAASDYDPGRATTLHPESVHINGNFVYGFTTSIDLQNGTYVNVMDNDIQASVTAIQFAGINAVLNIKNNHVEVSGARSTDAIHGAGLSTIVNTKVNIEGNKCITVGSVTSYGIRLNVLGVNQNQTNIRIVGNTCSGFRNADIFMSGAGDVNIEDNNCFSPIARSIQVYSALSNRPIFIDKNRCTGSIFVEPSANAAQVIVGANYGTFSTLIRGTSIIPNGQKTVTTSYASLGAATKNFDSSANTGLRMQLFLGSPDKNIGSVFGTASPTSVVITSSIASVGPTVIPWEVRSYQSNSAERALGL